MKKKHMAWLMRDIGLLKMIKIMRFTIIILLISLTQTFAVNSYSQQTKLTLNLKNVTVERVLDEIESNSEFFFLYNKNMIDVDRIVKVNVEGKSINEVLNDLFTDTNVTYTVKDRQVMLINESAMNSGLSAQKLINVSGKVTDISGEPLPGVTVVVKGTTNGTITNFDGVYTLSNVASDATIQFSFVGMKMQELAVNNQSSINIVMEEDAIGLEEVVAVGYGTQKKSNITGSVASIKTDDFTDLNVGVTEVIQGRVAGVDVSNGTIIIRGAASVNGSSPLVIVDGISGSIPNFNDIESIEILKDAASTAIYGARGAGGVILVTTKKGKAGELVINAKANVGVSSPIDIEDMLSTPDFIDRKLAAGFPKNASSGWDNPSALPNTNWNDLVWRNALQQNYFLQISGGSNKTTFNISADYYRNQSIEINAFDEGGSFRVASETKIGEKIKVSEVVSLGYKNSDPHKYGDGSSYIWYRQVPTMLAYDPSNETGGGWGKAPAGGYYEGDNILARIMSRNANKKTYYGRTNLMLDWDVVEGLKYQTNLSFNFDAVARNTFLEGYNVGAIVQQDRFEKSFGLGQTLRMLHTLTYEHVFADSHNLKAMVGYEALKGLTTTAGGWKNGFAVQPAEDMALGTGSKDATGSKYENRGVSQFARINYDYEGKYLFEASIRRDGYDNFGPSNRFGFFPSLSAGWNIGKESFIQDNISWISKLKLRGSYGRIGNNTVPQFLYESSYSNTYLYYSFDDVTTQQGFRFRNVANTAIKWEDVAQWNIGIDASFLNNRLNTTLEYYDKSTTDMLYSIGVPPSAGAYSEPFQISSSYVANIGEINNKGFEWMMQYRGSHKDFTYDVAFTVSTNKNKVVKLSDAINPVIWKGSSTALNSSIYRTENGQPMGQMYGYIMDGIIQDQAEIDQLNNSAPDGVYQADGTAPGDIKYKDLNGDKEITNDDKTYIGNPWPKLIYGLNLTMSWKGFDLIVGCIGNSKMDIFNSAKIYERSFFGDFNTTYKVFDAWSPTNKNNEHPRVINTDPNGNFKNVSSYFVENGSFFKIKNLHFGYNVPKVILSKYDIKGLKLFVNCDNMFIMSSFQGDPELGGSYLQRNNYSEKRSPTTKSVMVGLSLTL